MRVCVDASLVIKWLIPEEGSSEALSLLKVWQKDNSLLLAPSLLDYEVGTVLRQKIIRGFLSSDDLFPALDFYKRLDLLLFHLTDLVSQSVAAAATLKQPTIYDIAYLLIAKQQKVDYVTADEKFYNAAHPLFSFV